MPPGILNKFVKFGLIELIKGNFSCFNLRATLVNSNFYCKTTKADLSSDSHDNDQPEKILKDLDQDIITEDDEFLDPDSDIPEDIILVNHRKREFFIITYIINNIFDFHPIIVFRNWHWKQ